MDKIYVVGSKSCWIRVVAYGYAFRAATNDQEAYEQVDKLGYRRNRADAQADLDKLANELHWNEVTDFNIAF